MGRVTAFDKHGTILIVAPPDPFMPPPRAYDEIEAGLMVARNNEIRNLGSRPVSSPAACECCYLVLQTS